MNTATIPIRPPLAPFAAKIHFKPGQLWQKKHKEWTFRSDQFAANNAPAEQHFKALEKMIMKDFCDTFVVASIFDNRLKPYSGPEKKNNLVFQICYNKIWIDRRRELDLSFLDATFDKDFIIRMYESFSDACCYNPLDTAISQYKQTFNL